jgi:hypothetical protein
MPEVYQQGQFAARGAEIVQNLCAVVVNQRGHGLDLDNDFFIADEIRGKCLNECTPAILQRLRWFREKWNALRFELNFRTFVIYRFEKAAAFVFVYSKAGADGGVAFRLANQFSTIFFSCHFGCFVGKISGVENCKVNEGDNTETEEKRVCLKIADLD